VLGRLIPAKQDRAHDPAQQAAAEAPRRRCGWPKGRKRGPRKAKAPDVKDGAPAAADGATADEKLRAHRKRETEARRAKRASGRQGKTANSDNGANGSTEPVAATMWRHAASLHPKAPWKAVARAFSINEALAVDAYRSHALPPNIGPDDVTKFTELS
jgi:hypothetical protein